MAELTLCFFGREKDLTEVEVKRLRILRSSGVNFRALSPATGDDPKQCRQREFETLRKALPQKSRLILWDLEGETLTDTSWAERWKDFSEQPISTWMVIGGSHGFAPELKDQAIKKLSLGGLTWTHDTARAMIIEQCYRVTLSIKGSRFAK